MNTLYYGDNLPVLRQHIATESVDLIYLDPPFNSARNYNVLFKDSAGRHADAQIAAFADTWTWGEAAAATYDDLISQPSRAGRAIAAIRDLIGENALLAYLVMMTARLAELHRVLKPTGSLYLHCDPTASHYLKIILDAIFGVENFRNEITWKRTSAHSDTRQGKVLHMGRIHDIIFYYTKSENATRNEVYLPYDPSYIENFYRHVEEGTGRKYRLDNTSGPGGASKGNPYYEFLGVTRYWRYSQKRMQELYEQGRIIQTKPGAVPQYKRYLDEMPGIPLQDVWDDISPLGAHEKERLGYPTQKPLALLERIIQASSNPGDVVLDPFCGCGTAIAAAQKLGRRWIGIDITHLAIALQKFRLADMFGLQPGRDYRVLGEPKDLASAQQLAVEDRYQFQWWALSLLEARPYGAESMGGRGKKGSDKGIDGTLVIIDENRRPQSILIQVKSGHVKSGDIRDLVGTLEREKAPMGLFITLEAPSQPMLAEAASAGFVETPWGRFPRLQIVTIADLLAGRLPKLPPRQRQFKAAPAAPDSTQRPLDL